MKKLTLIVIILLAICQVGYTATNTFVKYKGDSVQSSAKTYTTNITGKCSVDSVMLHFESPSTANVGVWLDSAEGATYDTLIATSDSTSISNFFWQPDYEFIIQKEDNIKVIIGGNATSTPYAITVRGDYK